MECARRSTVTGAVQERPVARARIEPMTGDTYTFTAELWAWAARKELWVFATLPTDASDTIADQPRPPSGFGSVRVKVRLGLSQWSTSIFPGVDQGAYVLPIKKAVRNKAGIGVGDSAEITIELVD